MSCFRCFGAQPSSPVAEKNAVPASAQKIGATLPVELAAPATRLPLTPKAQSLLQPAAPAAVPPVVLQLQRELAALQGTWISRVDMALKYTMEYTGATAVSLSMLSQTHDCLVVLARRGPQHLVLPPGSCIAITEPCESAQTLDHPEQHSLQHLYASAAAVVACVPPPQQQQQPAGAPQLPSLHHSGGGGGSAGSASAAAVASLPLDWAHLHAAAGITHFAALPLYHGSTLAGALTILGTSSLTTAAAGAAPPQESVASAAPAAAPISSISAAAPGSAAGSATPLAAAAAAAAAASPLEALFRAPLSLELVAMSVAQCCLGADMALARHAVEMVQAMHACASIQQLVAGMSLGLQALMQARFCLTLRCNVALAVEFQPNAIMFEEAALCRQPSGSGIQNPTSHDAGSAHKGHAATGRASAVFSSPTHGTAEGGGNGRRDSAARFGSGVLPADGRGGAGGGGALVHMRSGLEGAGELGWGPSSGHVTASALLNQIVGRRYKARPFSVYHTLLIRTIHELAASAYGGTVITQCHEHMQDAKTPSRDIYALGRGAGQPPQCLVLSVTHLRPADDMPSGDDPTSATAAAPTSDDAAAAAGAAASGSQSGPTNFARRSAGAEPPVSDTGSHAHPVPPTPDNFTNSSFGGPASTSPIAGIGGGSAAAGGGDLAAPSEPRTYVGLYMTSSEPLPAALLELILVEVHSLACHMLSPLVHRKLLVGELALEWSLMQMVTSSSLPQDSASTHGRPLPRQGTSNLGGGGAAGSLGGGTAVAVAAAAAGVMPGRGGSSFDVTPVTGGTTGTFGTPRSTSVGSTGGTALTAPSTAAVSPELVPGGDGGQYGGPGAGAARRASMLAPSGPSSRMSSLHRIMAPFLMADMVPGEPFVGGIGASAGASGGGGIGTGMYGTGVGVNGRRSSDVAFALTHAMHHLNASVILGGSSTANGGGGGGNAPCANSRSLGTMAANAAGAAAGIRRMLALDGGGGGKGGTSFGSNKQGGGGGGGSASASMSEGTTREMMLAAAVGSASGGCTATPDKYLSTEVTTVQDTHSQMGLLVTSYKETLHNMNMELSVGAVQRQSLDLHADDPGRLVLREVLGKGGHGVVFRGTMHSLEVAIKVFQTPGEDEPLAAGTASRPEVLAEALLQRRRVLTRAALELAIMSSISHPNIVQVYAQWPTALLERDETQPCRRRLRKLPPDTPPPTSGGLVCAVMVMEYCDKGTLVDAINRGDFVTPARDGSGYKANYKAIYTTLLEVALALRHLASMAITHCDVKPANILLRSSPRDPRGFTAKLADFGYAALLRDSSPDGHRSVVTDEACGTVTHMAPESFVEGEPVDSSADVYAFGILMWELLSGKQPYHDRNLKQLPHEVVNKGLRPTFPPNTPDVYKMLAKSCWSPLPRNRPTAAQVVQSIQAQLDKIEAVARLLGKS